MKLDKVMASARGAAGEFYWISDEVSIDGAEVEAVRAPETAPDRYAIVDLSSGESWLVRGNATELRELLEVEWVSSVAARKRHEVSP